MNDRSAMGWNWPPWGLIFITLLHALGSSFVLIRLIPQLQPPPDPNCVFHCNGLYVDYWETGTAPYLIALFSFMLISSLAALLGRRVGRIGLLVALCVVIAWGVIYETYAYVRDIVAVERPGDLLSVSFWWSIAPDPVVSLLWIAFNGWYLFGAPTAQYFEKQRSRSSS